MTSPSTKPSVSCAGIAPEKTNTMKNIVLTSLIADALSLGSHWIYSQQEIADKFGRITGYPRVKLLVSPADHSILGCHLVGPESSTLLHQVMTLMRLKNDVRELASMIYIHPALNECLLAAAVQALGKVKQYRSNL